ncbi:hypothetical protein PFICI_09669 [Pestalotiopsis fici W106-1]|uniref:O-methyltransferase C-terminal domain-containing protein n=1 Tax=Pestalotiopsis fici (strain W106-1 / CGMCC3.15140) TaxID=1229662 RepID=W3WWU7_PESFW|nr:uncharacterized protein PFICI_09669 [Pestalotiopsis fici W106-1]ETS77607.1 hypothetical protein PFICI_09669 [Pestalotiopsis fici W106-1]
MATNSDAARLLELAASISKSAQELHDALASNASPFPSLDEDAQPIVLTGGALAARDAILDAASEFYDRLLDPFTLLFRRGAHNNMVSLHAISHFGIAGLVPVGGQTTVKSISESIGLGEDIVRRILQHAISMRIFSQPEPSVIAHTKVLRFLVAQENRDWLRLQAEEMWPPAVKMLDALRKWPGSEEPNETAFSLANNTNGSIYDAIANDPDRAVRFGSAMKAASAQEDYVGHLLDHYDWASLGPAQVVDVGGSDGHTAYALARRFHKLQVVVQDMSPPPDEVVAAAGSSDDNNKDNGAAGRVRFMAHDFFQTQTVAAEVYHFRRVMHNWSDKY